MKQPQKKPYMIPNAICGWSEGRGCKHRNVPRRARRARRRGGAYNAGVGVDEVPDEELREPRHADGDEEGVHGPDAVCDEADRGAPCGGTEVEEHEREGGELLRWEDDQ